MERDPTRARISGFAGTVVEISVGTTLALRSTALAQREVVGAGAIAALVAVALVVLGPPAGDAPAHLYRDLLARDGVLVWDNLWYTGHYPFASYSLLAYLPAALVGSVALAVVSVAASAALFASVALEEWGEVARWPARVFAVCVCAPVFTGTYTYGLGIAALLASLWGFQRGRRWLGILCAGLTLGVSPLAFAFLCLALLAVGLTYRPPRRTWLVVGLWLAGFVAVQLAINGLFHAEGQYSFRLQELVWALVACGLTAYVASRSPRGRVIALLFLLLGIACAVAFLVDSPLGSNVTRFRALVLPLGLLVLGLAGWRPRWLAAICLVLASVYTFSPYVAAATGLGDTRAARAEFWRPALAFLRADPNPNYRVDVVPTFDNWEAYYVPQAGFALARGWYRQLDLVRNPALYRATLTGPDYREWLRANGVHYVMLPRVQLDRVAATAQAELLRSGRSGLVEVADLPDWTVYELPDATPILTGPAAARLTELGHERIAGWTRAPGSYLLRVRHTPYWAVSGDACVEPTAGGMTRLVMRSAGPFELRVASPEGLLRTVFGGRGAAC